MVIYFTFKAFNYMYPYNYCKWLSAEVVLNSSQDIKKSRLCVMTGVCEVSNIEIQKWDKGNEQTTKNFICVRKIEPWVWKW